MTVKTAFIVLLTSINLFAAVRSTGQSGEQSKQEKTSGLEAITLFFTGNELGAMQPCGCSGGQLGGLDRRKSIFDTANPQNRLIFDTGVLAADSTEQSLIKFNIIIQAYTMLGYDLINLTKPDIDIAGQTGLLDGLNSVIGCITAVNLEDKKLPERYVKKFTLKGKPIEAVITAIETEDQISRLGEQFESPAGSSTSVNIVVLNNRDTKTIGNIAETNMADLIIVSAQSDEPAVISEPNSNPLIIEEGRIGKYIGQIEVTYDDVGQKPEFSFTSIAVTDDIAQYKPLVELYRDYQELVKEANLIEKMPRFVLPDNLEYAGSKNCKLCHDYEYGKWLTSKQVFIPGLKKQASADSRHADAFATLEKVNSHYDPECVVCHVIGMQYQTGYVSPGKTPEMKDVGCENCHGPGSEHIKSLGAIQTSGPMSTCTDCHTAEHSAEYNANEKQYNEKVIHWREPVSKTKVKEPNIPNINIDK